MPLCNMLLFVWPTSYYFHDIPALFGEYESSITETKAFWPLVMQVAARHRRYFLSRQGINTNAYETD